MRIAAGWTVRILFSTADSCASSIRVFLFRDQRMIKYRVKYAINATLHYNVHPWYDKQFPFKPNYISGLHCGSLHVPQGCLSVP